MPNENQFTNSYKNTIHLYMETLDAYDFNVFFLKKFKRQDNGIKDVLPYDFADYRLNKILSKNTGKTIKKIEIDTDRDNYLSASEAIKYGIVDKII